MAKTTIKFYLADSSVVELQNNSNPEDFLLYIGKKIAIFINVFKGYLSYPDKLFLKDFYDKNLFNKEIVKVECYSDTFLLETITKDDNQIIDVRWQAGKFTSSDDVIQEQIDIAQRFI